ncbi:MAG: endonuclease [Bacilli bacterium]|nr:endonuclease [Bacilli bacterium]
MKKVFAYLSMLTVGVALSISVVTTVSEKKEVKASVGNYSTSASTYYNGITASSGQELLGQLHDLICTTHRTYTTYDDVGSGEYQKELDQYYENGQAVSGYIYDFYSQAKWPAAWDPTSGSTTGGYNREHVWCQSLSGGLWSDTSGSTKGGGSDMNHVRPLEYRLNSTRNNNPYGVVSVHNSSTMKYAQLGTNSTYALGGYYSNGVFEPIDKVKGDVARTLFYVYTHYNSYSVSDVFGGYATTNGSGSSSYFSPAKLALNTIVSASSEQAAINLLVQWSDADPVDDIETRRNNVAAKYQGNRNPFIDNQAYVNAIWGDGSVEPTPDPGGDPIVDPDVTEETITMKGFNSSSSTTYLTEEQTGTSTSGMTLIANNFNNTSGQTRGNQSSESTNFYIYNTVATPGNIDSIVMSIGGGNGTYSASALASFGSVSQATAATGNEGTISADSKAITWTIGNQYYTFFKIFAPSKFISGSATDVSIVITYKSSQGQTEVLVSSISLTPTSTTIQEGETVQLNASISPANVTNRTLSWTSEDTSIASVSSTGLVTGEGAGTVKIYCASTDGSNVQVYSTVKVTEKPEEAELGTNYKLVKSSTELLSGAKVLLASTEKGYVAGATNSNGNNRPAVTADFANEKCTPSSGAVPFTVGVTEEGYYSFYDESESGYIYAASSSANNLKTKSTLDNNGKWSIAFDSSYNVTAIAQGTNTRNHIRFNFSSKLFSAYAENNNMLDFQLYADVHAGVSAFISQYMHMDYVSNDNLCYGSTGYYKKAKDQLNSMGKEYIKVLSETSAFSAAFARICAWAEANDESFSSTNYTFSRTTNLHINEDAKDNSMAVLIYVLSGLSIGGFVFAIYRKRKSSGAK